MRTREPEVAAFNGMRTSAVARDLGCTLEHVVTLIKKGALKAVDISAGSRPEYRVARASFEAFMAKRRVT